MGSVWLLQLALLASGGWVLGFQGLRARARGFSRFAWVAASLELIAATICLTAVLYPLARLLGGELELATFSSLASLLGAASLPFQQLKAGLSPTSSLQDGTGLSPE